MSGEAQHCSTHKPKRDPADRAETRTLLDLPEIRDEMWKSIFQGDARKALLEGGARIGAF